jgi:AcrR family transcriptional regulator
VNEDKTMADEPMLRADAKLNRERILVAAEEAFLAQGADVSLDAVAKRAGVGVGTLYRRFPTREALLAAVCSERFVTLAKESRARDATLKPGDAVRAYLEELVMATCVYQRLAASLGTVLHHGTPGCNAITEEGRRQVHRAKAAGEIRNDVTFEDLVCVASAISLSVDQNGPTKARVAHLLSLFLDGITV